MNALFAAAAALALNGGAQPVPPHDHVKPEVVAATTPGLTLDPNVILRPPESWAEPQMVLLREHMVYLPETWTAEQRASYRDQLGIPPIHWTPEQRMLYQQHMANLPATWTPEQRAAYREQMAHMQSPWVEQPSPTGTAPNDPVDTQGASVVRDNARGIDADAPLEERKDEPQPPR